MLAAVLILAEGRVKVRNGVIAARNTLTVALPSVYDLVPDITLTLAHWDRLLRRENLPERLRYDTISSCSWPMLMVQLQDSAMQARYRALVQARRWRHQNPRPQQ
jgi:hypothetical protein